MKQSSQSLPDTLSTCDTESPFIAALTNLTGFVGYAVCCYTLYIETLGLQSNLYLKGINKRSWIKNILL